MMRQAKRPDAETRGATRRRFMGVVAACGLPLLLGSGSVRPDDGAPFYRWRGRALGAPAQITLTHPNIAAARAVIERCLAEVVRLESVFSLFLGESEISRLNRDGRLAGASLDLRLLLAESQRLGQLTGGSFDVTVQPLWALYAGHFTAAGPDAPPPPTRTLDMVRQRVDYRQIDISGAGAGFLRPGMAVTLNGIAQGYVTDRIASILHSEGFDRVLADLGEIATLSPPEGQRGWPVVVPGGDRILFADRAIATSSGGATRFDRAGRHHHLFDPRTGRSAHRHRSVSVISRSATLSDALSTALSVLPEKDAARLLRDAGAERAIFVNDSRPPLEVTA